MRRKQFQRTRDPALKTIWQDLQKQIKKRFSELRNKNFETNISQLDPGSKPFWKLSKILKKHQKPIPALREENKKAQKLAKQFESAHNFKLRLTSPIEIQVAKDFETILNQENVYDNSWESDLDELRTIIKKFKNMTAPGDDGIFQNTKVVPILKPDKNPADASSYRPNSLLFPISKLFEKVILNGMMVHINEN